jgi:phosphoglycerol transferase MdoB-like AlkP superfamily enzyme
MESAKPRPRRWWLNQRVWPFCVWGLAILLLFGGFRAGLLWACRERLADTSAGEILHCFQQGLIFDGFVVGVTGIPLVLALALAPNGAFARRWFRGLITGYLTALLILLFFTAVAGHFFVLQFGFRLNMMALDSIVNPRETIIYIWRDFPVVWMLLGLAVLAGGIAWLLSRILWSGPLPTGPAWTRPILSVVLLGLCLMGLRGWASGEPPNLSSAYLVSSNNVLAQAALNDICSIKEAIWMQVQNNQGEPEGYDFPSPERMAEVVRRQFLQPQDTDLGTPENPLWRRTSTGRPLADYNVVFIICERMAGRGVGAMGHQPSETPNLDALAADSVFFENMYASSMITCHGMVATLCGHPDTCLRTAMVEPRAQGKFLMLPGFFRQRGYKTALVYGGRETWENTREFFAQANGFEDLITEEKMRATDENNPWGLLDEITFRRAHEQFLGYGDQRFFGTILTVTNHEPFNAPAVEGLPYEPGDTLEAKKTNCYRYADWALGQFFKAAREAPYFKKTIFVIVSDHGRDFSPHRFIDIPAFHIPAMIYAPGLVAPRRISTVCSQTDLPPTILGLMGGQYEHCFFGRNIFEVDPHDGFAFVHANGIVGYVRGDRAMVLPPGHPVTLYRLGRDLQTPMAPEDAAPQIPEFHEKMVSIFGWATKLYRESHYGPPMTHDVPGDPAK